MGRLGVLKIAALICLPSVLFGCQTTNENSPGTGPIHLSVKMQNAYERYLALPYPEYFAIDPRSGAGWSHCEYGFYSCTMDGDKAAMLGCKKYGSNCKIFAYQGKITWKGPVTFANPDKPYAKAK